MHGEARDILCPGIGQTTDVLPGVRFLKLFSDSISEVKHEVRIIGNIAKVAVIFDKGLHKL